MKTKLGVESSYIDTVDASVLDFIPRALSRDQNQICNFYDGSTSGNDIWHAYEFSWLDNDGSPEVGVLRITIPSISTHICESKSLKIYLGGFAFTRFQNPQIACERIQQDLFVGLYGSEANSKNQRAPIVTLFSLSATELLPSMPKGYCVDMHTLRNPNFDIADKKLLVVGSDHREEIIYSHNFRSLCPVTAQPDWATVLVMYRGQEILPESLHRYLVSFRRHQGFHEACCEQIFSDIIEVCKPEELGVICCFTRRGGLDITPMRTNAKGNDLPFFRTIRQ